MARHYLGRQKETGGQPGCQIVDDVGVRAAVDHPVGLWATVAPACPVGAAGTVATQSQMSDKCRTQRERGGGQGRAGQGKGRIAPFRWS